MERKTTLVVVDFQYDFLELILELVNVKSRNELVALLVIGGVLAIIYYLFLV